jgi:hypothetical protein
MVRASAGLPADLIPEHAAAPISPLAPDPCTGLPSASEKTRGKSTQAHQRKLDRGGSGKPSWAGAKSHGGHGHGKGGNH